VTQLASADRVGWIGGGVRHDVERCRDLAGVDAVSVGFFCSTSRNGVYRRGLRWRGGDKRAAALLRVDELLLGEALVNGSDGVGVDREGLGEVTQTGKPLVGRKAAVTDACAQRPRQLDANRHVRVSVDGDVEAVKSAAVRRCGHITRLAAMSQLDSVLAR